MRNKLLQLAGALALVAVIGKFYAAPAIAQAVRAAVVKNIDEPGRTPYSDVAGCFATNGQCTANFSPLPPNKRLVIEYVNGSISSGGPVVRTGMRGPSPSFSLELPVKQQPAGNSSSYRYSISESMRIYVEGSPPPYLYFMTATNTTQAVGSFLISGHLIDLTQ